MSAKDEAFASVEVALDGQLDAAEAAGVAGLPLNCGPLSWERASVDSCRSSSLLTSSTVMSARAASLNSGVLGKDPKRSVAGSES